MIEIEIKSERDVIIKDNIIHINCGYQTNNVIPLSSIYFVQEIIRSKKDIDKDPTKSTYHKFIQINDFIKLITEQYNKSNEAQTSAFLVNVHEKIVQAMVEYHTTSYRINKPPALKISD